MGSAGAHLLFLKSPSELDCEDCSLEDESSPLGTSLTGKPLSFDVVMNLFLACEAAGISLARVSAPGLRRTFSRNFPLRSAGLGSFSTSLSASISSSRRLTSLSPSVSFRIAASLSCWSSSQCTSTDRMTGYGEARKAY